MPPPKMPESLHQASRALLIWIIARATPVPIRPQASVLPYNTSIDSLSPGAFWINRLYISASVSVAEQLRLLLTVLMAAAKIAAIRSPETPDGSACTMKNGNTVSPFPSATSACIPCGRSSGIAV